MANKQKTNKSAAARFKITKKGKLLHRTAGIRHLRSSKSRSQLRRMSTMKEMEGVIGKKVRRMLGTA